MKPSVEFRVTGGGVRAALTLPIPLRYIPAMADRPDPEGEKPVKRRPLKARPQPDVDREQLRADIRKRFSKTFEYLAK